MDLSEELKSRIANELVSKFLSDDDWIMEALTEIAHDAVTEIIADASGDTQSEVSGYFIQSLKDILKKGASMNPTFAGNGNPDIPAPTHSSGLLANRYYTVELIVSEAFYEAVRILAERLRIARADVLRNAVSCYAEKMLEDGI